MCKHRHSLNLVITEGLVCAHIKCDIHTLALTAGDKQTLVCQSCSPHGPRAIRLSGHKGRDSVWAHITYMNTPELKWVACVSVGIRLRLFFSESSCPFIIQSRDTKVNLPVLN